jgi:hypothetical protein
VVVDESLPAGLAANAVGVLAVTLGATLPALVGSDLRDADGGTHRGLIVQGLPVLAAPTSELTALRDRARVADLGVIDFPRHGQKTTDYDEFGDELARLPAGDITYLGLLVFGPRRAVGKLTGHLRLLR